jgi:hypothetical protein
MGIIRSRKKKSAPSVPHCGKHGAMRKQGGIYVCSRPGCFATDQQS